MKLWSGSQTNKIILVSSKIFFSSFFFVVCFTYPALNRTRHSKKKKKKIKTNSMELGQGELQYAN